MKELVIGHDYGCAFGTAKGQELIYNGGNSWTGRENGVETITMDDADLVAGALAYINRPTISMGRPKF